MSSSDKQKDAEKIVDEEETTEQSEEEHHEDDDHIDYSEFSKKQLISALKELLQGSNYMKADKSVHEIKTHFDELLSKEKDDALKQFISDGGVEADFEFRNSDEDRQFFILYHDFREKKSAQYKELERSKETNLHAKNKILNTLRELVDGEETTHSISTIKAIQEDWKKIGPVPSSQNRNLWASYNALMDRFYDNRSIYFELKELDRKKNLESKLELCEKAEALVNVKDLKEAIKLLNDLHEEFKHIGPVPREEQESLWQRFKEASDAIYSRRKEYYESQKEVFKVNQDKKEGLIEKLNTFTDFTASRIKEWNIKTKEILEIQKEWEKIGPVPREVGKDINRAFWGAFKQFFHNKNLFFKELDEIRQANKLKAEALITRAEEVMDSSEWQDTANTLIGLQKEWKEIGPTPEKVRDELYKRFKSACDTFFENKRKANKQVSKEFDTNLELKEAICQKINTAAASDDLSPDELEKLILEYQAIGFVPRKNIKEIAAKFNDAVDTYVKNMGLEGVKRDEFLFRLNLNKIQGDPNLNRVLNKKEHGIRKQISDLENNVTLWRNNLEFFASSKTADKLKDQFDEKIEKAEKEIEKLKKKLSIIREF
nr:DUF349 domain-containing protein [Pararhodonellum marinum]